MCYLCVRSTHRPQLHSCCRDKFTAAFWSNSMRFPSLSNSNLRDNGAIAVAKALEGNTSLTSLKWGYHASIHKFHLQNLLLLTVFAFTLPVSHLRSLHACPLPPFPFFVFQDFHTFLTHVSSVTVKIKSFTLHIKHPAACTTTTSALGEPRHLRKFCSPTTHWPPWSKFVWVVVLVKVLLFVCCCWQLTMLLLLLLSLLLLFYFYFYSYFSRFSFIIWITIFFSSFLFLFLFFPPFSSFLQFFSSI